MGIQEEAVSANSKANSNLPMIIIIAAALAGVTGLVMGVFITNPYSQPLHEKIKDLENKFKEKTAEIVSLRGQLEALKKVIAEEKSKTDWIKANAASELSNQREKLGNPQKPSADKTKADYVKTKIKSPLFGVRLGEPLSFLRRRKKMTLSSYQFSDQDYPSRIWELENRDSDITSLSIYSFNSRIYELVVNFADASQTNFYVIKKRLAEKYGGKEEGLFDSLAGEVSFDTQIDGIEIKIELNRDTFVEEKLELHYTHVALFNCAVEEFRKRKATKVQDKL